ncbi:gp100 [Sphingomonas phage PAU]|uniref:gp100 n=1 Tax=Sphingomonas phage PAU TaxID=1150991 RepID=UPI0002573257|nr:gp100 [Sphingomonas phage PAU]AFF28098.1 gp100 [Sphingomonas phage PAU]
MKEQKYMIVQTVSDLSLIPFHKRFKGLLVYVIDDKRFYVIKSKIEDFEPFNANKQVVVSAKDFINLTVYHNLNARNIQVHTISDKGVSMDIYWKLGTSFDINNTANIENAITLMSGYPIKELIHIIILELN